MRVVAILLFGSLARADESEGSDTDLLMVNLDCETRHVWIGHLSLFLYPGHMLEHDAREGDHFVCQLVCDASLSSIRTPILRNSRRHSDSARTTWPRLPVRPT